MKALYNNEVHRRMRLDNYVHDLKMAMLTALKMIDEKYERVICIKGWCATKW